jgi:5S rRNA maturation endonuclease (ribonuclease M5)
LIYLSINPLEIEPEWAKRVIVVEGPMDALAAVACGYDAIALMGINPGEKALDHLKRLVRKRDTLVLLDSEPEATQAAHAVCMVLASTGTNARCATLQHTKDLASCGVAYRQEFLDEQMEDF